MPSKKICRNCRFFTYFGVKDKGGDYDLKPLCLLDSKIEDEEATCSDWAGFEERDKYGC